MAQATEQTRHRLRSFFGRVQEQLLAAQEWGRRGFASLDATRKRIAPVLEAQGYDYFWRPSWGDDTPPFYAWFIKRANGGQRTHHIHMVEADFAHWERLLFRDYLIEHPDVAKQYGELKETLSKTHGNDRVAYTKAKTDFIKKITEAAHKIYRTLPSRESC